MSGVGSLRPVSGTAEELLDLLRDWDRASGEPEPLIVETSGSTGRPKRVVLSRRAMRASADATHERLGGPGQWWLTVPPTYVAGLQVLFRSVRAGTEPVIASSGRLEEARRNAADAERRYLSLVPTQLVRALAEGCEADTLTTFDAVLVGGGPLRSEDRLEAEATGVRVVQTYGMSETCGGCVYDGAPLAGARVAIDAVGQVLLAGPMMFDGYAGEPDRTAQALVDGWLRTDDLGELDGEGRLRILGRVDDVAISGGVKVPLPAVERMLREHPSVDDVAVVGVPDAEWGERVVAIVETADGAVTLDDLRDVVEPRTWAPRAWLPVVALPRLANGKPDRVTLKVWAADA